MLEFGKLHIRLKNGKKQCTIPYRQQGTLKWHYTSKQGFKTDIQARTWANERMNELQDEYSNPSILQYNDLTFKEAFDIFLKTKKKQVKTNTYLGYLRVLKHSEPLFNKPIKDIIPFDFDFINDIERTKEATALMTRTGLRTFFKFCKDELRIIKDNPVTTKSKYKMPTERPTVTIEQLNDIVKSVSTERKIFYLVAFHTGARIGELEALKLKDFTPQYVTINKQIQHKEYTDTKNGNHRQIPITSDLYKLVVNYVTDNCIDINRNIFNKHKTLYLKWIHEDFKQISEKFTTHCFRHSYATHLISNGVDYKTVSILLGDTVEMVMKTYSQKNIEKIEETRNLMYIG